ncbi:MAG: hypothetical protein ACRDOH_01040 [Streptosporangiaceae bacterium]
MDGVTVAMSVPPGDHGWQRACRARLPAVMAPVPGGVRDPGCAAGGDRACPGPP